MVEYVLNAHSCVCVSAYCLPAADVKPCDSVVITQHNGLLASTLQSYVHKHVDRNYTAMVGSIVVVVDDNKSKIVTKFLLKTYRLRQPSDHHVQAAARRCEIATDAAVPPTNAGEFHFISLITGSIAEFRMQPMLSCVSDVDLMYHRSDVLAIPKGFQPPEELPAEFHSHVEVFEIKGSEFPG